LFPLWGGEGQILAFFWCKKIWFSHIQRIFFCEENGFLANSSCGWMITQFWLQHPKIDYLEKKIKNLGWSCLKGGKKMDLKIFFKFSFHVIV
jgi:hypothetical protein